MIIVLLPAYNEEQSLPLLLPKIDRTMRGIGTRYRIVVCDDGSRDRTAELLTQLARDLPIDVITHKINRGLGETVRDLFERAAETCQPDDVIIRMDCDDTHEPDLIPKLMEVLDAGADVAIASRFRRGGGQIGVNRYRAFISRCANLYMKSTNRMKNPGRSHLRHKLAVEHPTITPVAGDARLGDRAPSMRGTASRLSIGC